MPMLGIRKEADRAHEEIALRNEICVKNGDEIGARLGQRVIDVACLGVRVVRPVQIADAFGFAECLEPRAPAIIENPDADSSGSRDRARP